MEQQHYRHHYICPKGHREEQEMPEQQEMWTREGLLDQLEMLEGQRITATKLQRYTELPLLEEEIEKVYDMLQDLEAVEDMDRTEPEGSVPPIQIDAERW